MLYNKDWMDKSPEAAQAFTIAYLKAARDYYDAMIGGPRRAEVIDILMKYTGLKTRALYDKIQWSYMDPNAELSLANLRDQQRWYEAQGALQGKVDVETMVDRRFLDKALEKLGRVEVRK